MLAESLVGWLVGAVGTTVSRRLTGTVLGSAEERALRGALAESITAVVAQVPENARDDLDAALREHASIPTLDSVAGDGAHAILVNVIQGLVAPLALPGQTLANHRVDAALLVEAMLDALLTAIRRTAVTSGALTDLAQLIGLERLEVSQRRLERLLAHQAVPGTSGDNLPRSVVHFTGRESVLRRLRAAAIRREPSVASSIVAIDGIAGVGKTELAVRLAHLLKSDYPDAQVYIDLRGFTPGFAPMPPERALESLLITVGMPPDRVPPAMDQRMAAWRAQMSGSRAIIVLDNAADASQVAPLLPGSACCFVLVTSRRSMAELDDVELLTLDVLEEYAAMELFTRILGERAKVKPADVRDLVRLCGFLPLAVRLAAGRIRRRPQLDVLTLAHELANAESKLESLRSGDREARAAFEVSYRGLEPELQVAFRRLGIHPGPTISVEAAAALIDTDPSDAERRLVELLGHSLLLETTMARFEMHDLIREFANERVRDEEEQDHCLAAERRLMALFSRKATVVNDELSKEAELSEGPPGAAWARDWLETERTNLVAVARLASERADRSAVDLARQVGAPLMNLGFMDDAEILFRAASNVGSRLSDPAAQAMGLLGLGEVARFTARYDRAREDLGRAHSISQTEGNQSVAADALYSLGEIERTAGELSTARSHYESAQRICKQIGHTRGEANALRGMGEVAQAVGDLDRARESYVRSHTLCVADGNRQAQAFALLGLGEVERAAGNFATSRVHYEAARSLCMDTGDRRGQANAAYGLGELALAMGSHGVARQHFSDSYSISAELANRRGLAYSLLGIGDSLRATGEYERARERLDEARAMCREIGDGPGEARALAALGDIASEEGDRAVATQLWHEAAGCFRLAGLDRRAEEMDQRVSRGIDPSGAD